MISISTVEFRCYVVIIILVNLGKPLAIRDSDSWDWSALNEPLSLMQGCGFQTRIFIARFLGFVYYIVRISDEQSLGVYNQSNLLDRMFWLYFFQPCPQDLFTFVLIFNATYKIRCCEYWYCLGWYRFMMREIEIYLLFISRTVVHGKYYITRHF